MLKICGAPKCKMKKLAAGVRGYGSVQLMKNRAFHSGIKRTPYEALFGCKAKVGITKSYLPEMFYTMLKQRKSIQTAKEQEETDEGMQKTCMRM
ncbi:integrase core domain protein [Plakobranchus ocellatus]|uniref:Integrase core domain protein n=1 Tax=Plakobranchus ocellatus TaxID=259542 RepID=A0AAV3Y7C7_9GAST|nr:integrase core domain protein [Plakobranchus ocellatus]